jgi:UTP--glucose-1-phosphate uridylyltransferase
VLTPDVFDEIAAGRVGALGEIQLTDALRAQAHRSPFHGVVSHIDRFDTGTPFGFLTAAIELGLRDPNTGKELRTFLDDLLTRTS